MKKVKVKIKSKNEIKYNILIKNGILKNTGKLVKKLLIGERVLIVTDNIVANLYVDKIKKSLEKENNHLHKVVDKFYETVEKFIDWICQKFGIGESKELVREFEKETNMYIDPEKQLKKEERAKEWDLEI